MNTKPIKIIICKDGSSEEVQEYLYSIGYNWKKDEYNFGTEYSRIKTFYRDIIIILLDNKTFAWETYDNYINQYLNDIFKNTSTIDSNSFLLKSKRGKKLSKINEKI